LEAEIPQPSSIVQAVAAAAVTRSAVPGGRGWVSGRLRRLNSSAWRWGAVTRSGTPVLLVGCAILVWTSALPGIDVRRVNDLGLVSVLPLSVFLALTILTCSFCMVLRRETINTPLMLLHVGALILMLYAITMFVEHGVIRFAATYKHIGIAQYVLQTGNVNPSIDAYFNWPGFFILSAFVSDIAGFHTVGDLALWAPVYYNVFYLAPMFLILSSATGDKRLVWLGVWFFYLTNWVGQDYFSPQGLDFFLYLVVLAVVLTWFKANARWPQKPFYSRFLGRLGKRLDGWLAPPEAPNLASTPRQRVALIAIIVAIMAVTVPSHQLTPFAVFTALSALVLFNRSSLRFMPVLLLVLIGLWLSYMAESYLSGHFTAVTGHVGSVGSTVNSNLTDRLAGSRDHVIVVYTGLLLTLTIWGVGALGALRSLRRGYWDLTFALLFVAPFSLALVQSYEGELALRVYLFALPAVAFFAAALFYTAPGLGRSWRTSVAILVLSQVLAAAFLVSRYGNERMDFFTQNEVTAVNHLYAVAPPKSLLLAGSDNIPWRFRGYTTYNTTSLDDPLTMSPTAFDHGLQPVIGHIEDLLANNRYPDHFFIITRSEKAYVNLFKVFPTNSLNRLEVALMHSPRFRLIYRNPDATIFKLTS
jgi:hypothetical protein